MNEELQLVALKLLENTWKDIHFRYSDLTDTEKSIINPEQFREIMIALYKKDLV